MKLTKIDRTNPDSSSSITLIGTGSLGGKAKGLVDICDILELQFNSEEFHQFEVSVPRLTILRSDVFDSFMEQNNLHEIAYSERADERIAHAFQNADLPFEVLGDLKRICNKSHTPFAVRSSSKLEDAMYEPFAGIYATKMTPNNQHDVDSRFRKLIEAIKFVYASTYFKAAKDYMLATNHQIEDEKMSVIIQEVVGCRNGDRFYPELSGVARSYNFYSMGRAKPEDGVVNFALGLGKTIVDGGVSWPYSPSFPKITPPFASISEMLKQTQLEYWMINMGKLPSYDPIKETEYMLKEHLTSAEKDGKLKYLVSTVERNSGQLRIGTGADGPRVLTFAPLLTMNDIPINDLIKKLLKICEENLKAPVEIEFAVTFSNTNVKNAKHKFGFLQVRPMVVSNEEVLITKDELNENNILAASENVLGNGTLSNLSNIVYVKPEVFEAKYTKQISEELKSINKKLIDQKKQYLLIGFGRWGSSDPWLGIPVDWSNISGAKVLVEATLENMNVELSQGSHFFHNLTSFNVPYFSIPFSGKYKIDWNWLSEQELIYETDFVKHVKLSTPLLIKVDGKTGRGLIIKN